MLTVRDAMTRSVISVGPDDPLKDVARSLLDAGVSGVPVVDSHGAVLGIVSEADFLIKGQGPQAIRHRRLARLLGESAATREQLTKLGARTAGEAMTSPAVTIGPAQSLQEAAAIMTEQQVNRLPVVDHGSLVGILTRADLVRAYVRSDEELEQTIREEVLHRILWLDPAGFEVSVRDGNATIRGHVEQRSTARIVEETIAMVPGVMTVTTDITWTVDDRALQPAASDPEFPYSVG